MLETVLTRYSVVNNDATQFLQESTEMYTTFVVDTLHTFHPFDSTHSLFLKIEYHQIGLSIFISWLHWWTWIMIWMFVWVKWLSRSLPFLCLCPSQIINHDDESMSSMSHMLNNHPTPFPLIHHSSPLSLYPPNDLFMHLYLQQNNHHLLTTPSSSHSLLINLLANSCLHCNKYDLTCSHKHSFIQHPLPLSLDDLGAGKTEFKTPHPSSPITAHLSVASVFSRCLASLSSIPSLNPFKHSWIKRIP